MTTTNAALTRVRTVADSNASYDSMRAVWRRCRAVCNGEQTVKDFDAIIDNATFTNLLIPFSGYMTQTQYNFYKAEAELPGVTQQFGKMLVNGLLRKQPTVEIANVPQEATEWILNEIGKDDSPLTSFLGDILWEEAQTSRSWIVCDYPKIENPDKLTQEDFKKYQPYPIHYRAEDIVNWRMTDMPNGSRELSMLIIKGTTERYDAESPWHPILTNTVWVHELVDGLYQVSVFKEKADATNVPIVNGQQQQTQASGAKYEMDGEPIQPLFNGARLEYIPAWPSNGSVDCVIPMLSAFVDKEVALYNKISRRNHLLYGAATYTPIIASDMKDEDFEAIVAKGLGSWLKIGVNDKATVLETPTAALADMDRAIAAGFEELARMGVRILAPDKDQSGVALEIKNAAQSVQLSSLSNRVTNTMRQVIAFLVNWRYNAKITTADVKLTLADDLSNVPMGADWLRLATEWYENGLIPRNVWLILLKSNELLPADYDDEEGQKNITDDQDLLMKTRAAKAEADSAGDNYADRVNGAAK